MAGRGGPPTTVESFMRKVYPCPMSGCWLWAGAVCNGGHGQVKVRGVSKMAHRYAYEAFVGPIKEGLVLDHLCRNRLCVNPSHLRPCTDRENILAPGSEAVAAKWARRTRCGCGLDFTLNKNGVRECVPCRRQRDREYRLAHVEARRAKCRTYYYKNREAQLAKAKINYMKKKAVL